MLRWLKSLFYFLCCVLTAIVSTVWIASYLWVFEYRECSQLELDWVKSHQGVGSYQRIRIEDATAPVNSPFVAAPYFWGPLLAENFVARSHRGVRNLPWFLSQFRKLFTSRWVFWWSPPTRWSQLNPLQALNRTDATYHARNAMGTITHIELPYLWLIWLFGAWPSVRLVRKLRRVKSTN